MLESLAQLRRLRLGNVRLAQFTPRLAQALSGLAHLDCQGAGLLCGRVWGGRVFSPPLPWACKGTLFCAATRLHHLCLYSASAHPSSSNCPADPTCAAADVLAARPHRRAGTTLWEGLRHLASLSELRLADLGSSGGMPAAALACPHLTGLTLISTAVAHWPQHPLAFSE